MINFAADFKLVGNMRACQLKRTERIVRILDVISSPFFPSPRVSARRKNPFFIPDGDGNAVHFQLRAKWNLVFF